MYITLGSVVIHKETNEHLLLASAKVSYVSRVNLGMAFDTKTFEV